MAPDNVYREDETFAKEDFVTKSLLQGEYDNCTFNGCNFSNADLAGFQFTGCTFRNCDLTMANIHKTSFQNCRFKTCKLLGLHFEQCHALLFSVDFEECILDLSCFYKMKLKKTRFENSNLREVDFTESDLTEAVFDRCDLALATFDRTILEKADFREAFNYSLDPENNRIKKAKFSLSGIPGLLGKYDIVID